MKIYQFTNLLLLLLILPCQFLQAQDWPNLNRFKEDNILVGLPQPGENRVVFMGNSITEGWSITHPEFFEGKPYINRGISGQTTPQMLLRFRADVIKLKPAVVVILAGTNDIAGNTGPSTIEMIADNLISMAQLAKANGIRVVICSVLPVYDYPWKPGIKPAEKIISLNNIMKTFAEENEIVFADLFSAVVNDQNGMKSEYSGDGVHANLEGYMVLEPIVEQAILNALSLAL